MSTYTNDNNIRFLNDKNISLTLADDTVKKINTVPSLNLLNEVSAASKQQHDQLTTYIFNDLNASYDYDANNVADSPYLSVITSITQDKGQIKNIKAVELLSSHVKNLKEFVTDSINSLDVDVLSEANKFARTIKEVDGKVQATFENVVSSDIAGKLETSLIDKLDEYVQNIVDTKVNDLDVNTLSESNKFVRTVAEENGKLTATFENVVSSDIVGKLKQALIENLETDIDSCYKKAGGKIDGSVVVDGTLSVRSNISANADVKIDGNVILGTNTTVDTNVKHSIAAGVNAKAKTDYTFVWNGVQGIPYNSNGTGTFNINAAEGLKGVYIGDLNLDDISSSIKTSTLANVNNIITATQNNIVLYVNSVSSELSTTCNTRFEEKLTAAKEYTDGVSTVLSNACNVMFYTKEKVNNISNALSTTCNTKFEEKLDEANTYSKTYTDGVSTTLSNACNVMFYTKEIVNNISNELSTTCNTNFGTNLIAANNYTNSVSSWLSVELSNNLATDYKGKITTAKNEAFDSAKNYIENKAVLISSDSVFSYSASTRALTITLKDINNEIHTYTVDTREFEKDRIIDSVAVQTTADSTQYIEIKWKTAGDKITTTTIPLNTLANIYTAGEGIVIKSPSENPSGNSYNISVNYNYVTKRSDFDNLLTTLANVSSVTINELTEYKNALENTLPLSATAINTLNDFKTELENTLPLSAAKIVALSAFKTELENTLPLSAAAIEDLATTINQISNLHDGTIVTLSTKLSTDVDNLSTLYMRRAKDTTNSVFQNNLEVTEEGFWTNYLAGTTAATNGKVIGGIRVFNDVVDDNAAYYEKQADLAAGYTAYTLNAISNYANITGPSQPSSARCDVFSFEDNNANTIVRKATGARLLSDDMFDALKDEILKIIYPINAVYITTDNSETTCAVSAVGTTWSLSESESLQGCYIWTRTE